MFRMRLFSAINITFVSLTLVSVVLSGCSSTPAGDASIAVQDRKAYHLLKYADPATGAIPENITNLERDFVNGLKSATRKNGSEEVQAFAAFRQVGPYNVGGRTRALAMDITNSNVLLAGGISGGMWRSTDAGNSWTLTTNPTELHNVSTIWQDPRENHQNEWYYGTGEIWGNSAQITGNGLWRSIDSGKTWTHLPSTATNRIPASHAFAYNWRIVSSGSNIFVATARGGIQLSATSGSDWTATLSSDSYFSDVAVTNSGRVYAYLSSFNGTGSSSAVRSGVFTTLDGETWTDITPADFPVDTRRGVFGIVPGTENFYLIAYTPEVGQKGVFRLRSGDREEWHSLWKYTAGSGEYENRSANIPLFGGRNGDFFSQQGYDLFARVSPHDTNLVILGGTNIYRSTDGYTTTDNNAWIGGYGLPSETERFPQWPNQHPDQHEVLFHPTQPKTVISGNDGGVYTTTDVYKADTVEWETNNRGYFTTQFYAIAVRDTAGDPNVLGGTQDNGTWEGVSDNSNDPFVRRNGGDGAYCAYADSGRTLYVSTQQGRVRRVLLDNDGIEVARTRVDPAWLNSDDYLFINPFVIDPNAEERMYVCGGGRLWRNNDLTQIPLGFDDSTEVNWDSLPATDIPGGFVSAIAISRVPADIVYYGTSTGNCYRLNNASVNGSKPFDISAGLGPGYINNISVDQRDAEHVIVTFTSYGVISIYESTNGGQDWRAIAGNLEEFPSGSGNGPAVNWTEIVPYNETTSLLVAATSTGLFFTPETNGMSTVWTQIAEDEIGNVPIDMVVTRYSDKQIFVGTHGRGIFRGEIGELPSRPPSPTLVSPLHNSRGVYPDTVVVWNAVEGAVSYAVELSTDESFNNIIAVFDGVVDTTTRITGLEMGLVRYYWRVLAYAGGGKGDASEAFSFLTAVGAPETFTPANQAESVAGLPIELSWNAVDGANVYDVQVATNISFNDLIIDVDNVSDTTTVVPMAASGTRYFWRVRGQDADTFGLWSARQRFTTGVLTSIDEEGEAALITLWPNPASDAVVVTLSNELCDRATLTVTSTTGKVVQSMEVTNHAATFHVGELSAGTYTVNIECGARIIRKLVTVQH